MLHKFDVKILTFVFQGMQEIYNLIKMTERIQQCFESANKRRIATISNLQRNKIKRQKDQ